MRFEPMPGPYIVENEKTGERLELKQMSIWGCCVGAVSYAISRDHMHPEMGFMATWRIDGGSIEKVEGDFRSLQAAEAACRRHARGQ